MIHIPLGADIIVLADDSKREQKLLAFCWLPPSLSMRMIFKLSHKTTDQREPKSERGDKTKREHLAALHECVSPGSNDSYPSSLKKLAAITVELLW